MPCNNQGLLQQLCPNNFCALYFLLGGGLGFLPTALGGSLRSVTGCCTKSVPSESVCGGVGGVEVRLRARDKGPPIPPNWPPLLPTLTVRAIALKGSLLQRALLLGA